MVFVKISGRLGNQLFQYAFYLYLKENNIESKMDISSFNYVKKYKYELERIFHINEKTISNYSIVDYIKYKVERFFEKYINKKIVPKSHFYEVPGARIDFGGYDYKKNIYLIGWWQNKEYAEFVHNILKKKLTFPELDLRGKKIIEKYGERNKVFLHVRRGDYKKNPYLGNVCDLKYYFKAIKYIKNYVKNPVFLIFSDDIEWCKENFTVDEFEFIDWNSGNNSYRDMQMMSLCDHGIISNSTFSWWGAFLIDNKNKMIISPHNWSENISSKKICPSEWKLI